MARKLDRRTVRWMAVVVTFFVIVASVVLILRWLMGINHEEQSSAGMQVTLTQDGIVKDELYIEELSMRPGSKVESVATVTCETSGGFNFLIRFKETEPSPLKEYVDVTVKVEGELLGEYSLAELLGGQTMEFIREVKTGEGFSIVLVYEMPLDVDDSAQGLEAIFNVEIEAGQK